MSPNLTLASLFAPQPCPIEIAQSTVTGLTSDTRTLQPGQVFVWDDRLLPAKTQDLFAQARAKGAAHIISNVHQVGVVYHPAPNQVLAQWARQHFPQQPSVLLGVTGTNGKTSVAWFVNQLLHYAGVPTASMGTLGVYRGVTFQEDIGFTSPTAVVAHQTLQGLAQKGVSHAVLEVSSHALALHRLDGLAFQAVGFTNLSQDHLDFHGTMEEYLAAKLRLFTDLAAPDATAVVNIQAHSFSQAQSAAETAQMPAAEMPAGMLAGVLVASAAKGAGRRVLTVGVANAELVVRVLAADRSGLRIQIKYNALDESVQVPLLGEIQAENIAVALGLCVASGQDLAQLLPHVSKLSSVPGRLELIPGTPQRPTVVVDYAHTPDALAKALQAIRPVVPEQGKLWVVFGAGGDRDITKRPLMGQAAAKFADEIMVTDDNPRTENPAQIRQHVLVGCPQAQNVGDRAGAITQVLAVAGPQDVVLIAGKGHETYQIIGREKQPFDDRAIARAWLQQQVAA